MKKTAIKIAAIVIVIFTTCGYHSVQAQSYLKTKKPILRDIPTAVDDNTNIELKAIDNVIVSSSEGRLTIHFTKETAGQVDISVYDISGRLILKDNATSGTGSFNKTYDMDFANGIIIVELRNLSLKIVKKAMV
ncbi:MAG: T9SS type A sorting domain-containing protein [Bacteroidota bacterium]